MTLPLPTTGDAHSDLPIETQKALDVPNFAFFTLSATYSSEKAQNYNSWASLVAQWLRVHLPMQGTWVRAPVQEDPKCRGEAGPVSHGGWACTSGACAPQRERPQQ